MSLSISNISGVTRLLSNKQAVKAGMNQVAGSSEVSRLSALLLSDQRTAERAGKVIQTVQPVPEEIIKTNIPSTFSPARMTTNIRSRDLPIPNTSDIYHRHNKRGLAY
jgi:hypothetical protein